MGGGLVWGLTFPVTHAEGYLTMLFLVIHYPLHPFPSTRYYSLPTPLSFFVSFTPVSRPLDSSCYASFCLIDDKTALRT